MFLLSSAASLHGHEFSNPTHNTTPNTTLGRNNFGRSAFPGPMPRRNTTTIIRERSSRPIPKNIPSSELIVRFKVPKPEKGDDDEMSDDRSTSDFSGTTTGRKRERRRSIRSSTAFQIATPAPTFSTQKQRLLQIRPRLLLQLQLLSANSRPIPAIDVVPSTVVVPRLIKKFPRMFRGKGELGANDVMVLRSEEYDSPGGQSLETTDSDEELSHRDLMAVICPLGKDFGGAAGKTEIVMSNGSVWEATPSSANIYDFVGYDEEGNKITARWVKKGSRVKSIDLSENRVTDFRFTFSIIDPTTRRHPIMATLTRDKLDIPHHYVSVSPSATTIRSSPEDFENSDVEDVLSERITYVVDDRMKDLIQVTGVWVALRQGLSPYFKYNDAMASNTTSTSGRIRSMSLNTDGPRLSPSTTYSSTPESHGGKTRRCTMVSPASCASSPTEQKITPKRSVSTGAVFMQRAAARRSLGPPSTVASDSEGESHLLGGVGIESIGRDLTTNSMPSGSITPSGRLTLPESSATTPETPTKPQRRAQSAYVSASALQHELNNLNINRHSIAIGDGGKPSSAAPKPKHKISRWKTFTKLFRRTNSVDAHPN